MSVITISHKPTLAPFDIIPLKRKSPDDALTRKLSIDMIISIIQFLKYQDLFSFDVVCPAWHKFLNHAMPLQSNIALQNLLLVRTLGTVPKYGELNSKHLIYSKEICPTIQQGKHKIPEHAKIKLNETVEFDSYKRIPGFTFKGISGDNAFFSRFGLVIIVNKFSGEIISQVHLSDALNKKECTEMKNRLSKLPTREREKLIENFLVMIGCFILSESRFISVSKGGLISLWEMKKGIFQEKLKDESKTEIKEALIETQSHKFICKQHIQLFRNFKVLNTKLFPILEKSIEKVFKVGDVLLLGIKKWNSYNPLSWYSCVIRSASFYSNKQCIFDFYQSIFMGPNNYCLSLPKPVWGTQRLPIAKCEVNQKTGNITVKKDQYKYSESQLRYKKISYPIENIRYFNNQTYLVGQLMANISKSSVEEYLFKIIVWDIKTQRLLFETEPFRELLYKFHLFLKDNLLISTNELNLSIFDLDSQINFPVINFQPLKPLESIHDVVVLRSHIIIEIEHWNDDLRRIITLKFGDPLTSKPKYNETYKAPKRKKCLLM